MSKRGWYGKYIISKSDGSLINSKADYFVLRLDTDKSARHAVRTYARKIENKNPTLASDLRQRCDKYSE